MGIRNFEVISVGTNTSVQRLTIAAPGNQAIPTTAGGGKPKFLRITVFGGTAAFRASVTPQTSATNGVYATGLNLSAGPPGSSIVLNVHGYSHIGFDVSAAATVNFQFTPLEDF